jgi:hypothetical protein
MILQDLNDHLVNSQKNISKYKFIKLIVALPDTLPAIIMPNITPTAHEAAALKKLTGCPILVKNLYCAIPP